MGEALETRVGYMYQQQAVAEAEEEYSHYISALQRHPMELVGQPLPPLSGDENASDVVYSDVQQVREWQEAVRSVLQRGLEARVMELREEDADTLEVIHSSISMFQNNSDLIPNTPGFNRQLADNVAQLLKPYELRMDGRLTGYRIDPQGIIDQARGQLAKQSAASPAKPAKKAPAKKTAAPPQAGIPSRAGTSGGAEEDYTPMWQALGIDSAPI